MIKRLLLLILLAPMLLSAQGNTPPTGTLVASNFGGWTVPQGSSPANGSITWSAAQFCTVTSGGYTFAAFRIGRPITIVDANPSLTEVVTPTAVRISQSGCNIQAVMANAHISYYIKTGTAGLQEAIDYQSGAGHAVVNITPGFTALGGTTGMITSASGSTSVSILDGRTSVIVPYVWNGSAYAATPFSSGGNVPSPQFSMFYQPTAGTAGTAQGDPNITTDGSGNMSAISGTFSGAIAANSTVAEKVNNVYSACSFSGSTADVKITACLAATPSGGTCDARCFGATTQSFAATVTVPSFVTLVGSPSTIYQAATSGVNMFVFEPDSHITGFQFDCTNQGSYSGNVFANDPTKAYGNPLTMTNPDSLSTSVDNILINKSCLANNLATPLNLTSTAGGTPIYWVSFNNWRVIGMLNGVLLTNPGTGQVNDNHFTNWVVENAKYCMHFTQAGGNFISGNVFTAFSCESALPSGKGVNVILADGSGSGITSFNTFVGTWWDYADANTVAATSTFTNNNFYGWQNVTGYNTATGWNALNSNTGTLNTGIGAEALQHNTTGGSNVGVGYRSNYINTTGSFNTAVGAQAGDANSTSNNTSFFGYQAGLQNTSPDITAVGAIALASNTTGLLGTAVGSGALHNNSTGNYNVATGYRALFLLTTGSDNTADGTQACDADVTGSDNTCLGFQVLQSATASDNTGVGSSVLQADTSGSLNTGTGYRTLYSDTTGAENTGAGAQALGANIAGNANSAFGYLSLTNTTASSNSGLGAGSLDADTTGANNTGAGYQALFSITTGSTNTGVGYNAGKTITGGSTANQTSGTSTYLGAGTMASADGDTNETVIGYNATGNGSNTVTIGNSSVTDTYLQGTVHGNVVGLIGTTSTITGTALTATCDSGTATVAGAVVGHPVAVSSTTGADVGGAFDLRASVTSSNTVTVYICGTGTPASLAYNVAVF